LSSSFSDALPPEPPEIGFLPAPTGTEVALLWKVPEA